jgi:tol-pal system protein YbgF
LDKNLESTISKLNQTTAELVARVNESDQQTRRLKTMIEENQVKLDALTRNLNELTQAIYRQYGLTGSTPTGMPGAVIEPPPPTLFSGGETGNPEPYVAPSAPTAVPRTVTEAEARTQYELAFNTYKTENYDQALLDFGAFIQRFPQSQLMPNARFFKGRCYLKQENYLEAIQEFKVVQNNYPTSSKVPVAMQNHAVALSRLGQSAEAIRLLEEVVDNYPFSPAAEQAKYDLKKLKGN